MLVAGVGHDWVQMLVNSQKRSPEAHVMEEDGVKTAEVLRGERTLLLRDAPQGACADAQERADHRRWDCSPRVILTAGTLFGRDVPL